MPSPKHPSSEEEERRPPPTRNIVYIIYQANYQPARDYWRRINIDLNPSMTLGGFVKTYIDPHAELSVAVLVPAEDLRYPTYRHSKFYEHYGGQVLLNVIAAKGGVCLIFEGSVIFSLTTSSLTT